jgi:hypothetical protein
VVIFAKTFSQSIPFPSQKSRYSASNKRDEFQVILMELNISAMTAVLQNNKCVGYSGIGQ